MRSTRKGLDATLQRAYVGGRDHAGSSAGASAPGRGTAGRFAKRSFDVMIAGMLLLALVPIFVLVALLIVIDSGGPVLYGCERIGHKGHPFKVLKFRKMHNDAQGLPLSTAGDPRYTRVGGWLARTKLDELPQLWNVFIGQMSIVGPRPEDPRFVAERPRDYDTILAVKQGITGLSQLAFFDEAAMLDPIDPIGHYKSSIWPQKIALDCFYVEHGTLAMDFRILFLTVARTLLRRPVGGNPSLSAARFRAPMAPAPVLQVPSGLSS